MMIDTGCAAEYKGKTLSEININPQEAQLESEPDDADIPDVVDTGKLT